MAGTQQSLACSDYETLLGWAKLPTRPRSALWATSEVPSNTAFTIICCLWVV